MLTLVAFAGEETAIDVFSEHEIVFKLWDDIGFGAKSAWVLTTLSMCYAWMERRLRRRKTKTMADRITELETMIDPNRTSSGLTKTGDTPKGG
jgi:hypothetical protein